MGLKPVRCARLVPSLVLLASLVLPSAVADHEFSHRVEIYGRVVDAEGHPVPGAPVNVTLHGIDAPLLCFDAKDERTDERGDFHVCRHHHELPAGVEATVEVAGTSQRLGIDPHVRRAYVALTLDAPWDVRSIQGERAFYRNVTITARVVDALPKPVRMEGVEVPGTPRVGATANVTLTDRDGATLAEGNATTSEFGELRLDLPVVDVPEGARVELALAFAARNAVLDPVLRRADLVVVHQVEAAIAPPGSQTPVPLVVAVAALAAAALWARRR